MSSVEAFCLRADENVEIKMPEGFSPPDTDREETTRDDSTARPLRPGIPLSAKDAAFVATVEASMERLVRENSDGVLLEAALTHILLPGRRIRVRLAAAAADAIGVPREKMAPWAAAIELLHNATLVHDDLQDRDVSRRGSPTVWKQFGDNEAVNVGDLLLMLPALALESDALTDGEAVRLTRALHRRAAGCVNGQSGEQWLLPLGATTYSEWEVCARGKTGHLFALPVEGAALLAGTAPVDARSMGDAFADAGIIFQIVDDVLDLFGAHNGGGRGHGRRGGDIYEGRVSSLVAEYLEFAPERKPQVLALLRKSAEDTSAEDVRALALAIRESGALHAVLDRVEAVKHRVLSHSAFVGAEPALIALCGEWLSVLTIALEDVDTKQVPEVDSGAFAFSPRAAATTTPPPANQNQERGLA